MIYVLDTKFEFIADQTNYVLWNAQIYATQGSMARCNVPDVLKLYSKCMNNMYKRNRSDATMISKYNDDGHVYCTL